MSTRLVDAAATFLEQHTTRRGFLRRAAIVGSALATAPVTYALRPGTAYSRIVVGCSDCPPGSLCCSGFTAFCCEIHGANTCPPGTVVAGWWRAEGSGFCGGASRYYMDCNALDCGGCGCGSSGTCAHTCVDCSCGCANDDCNLRKACCTRFRYGQCNQQYACLGPIECRVVSCLPPWEFDSTCTTADARNDATAFHDAPCLHPSVVRRAKPAVVTGNVFTVADELSADASTDVFSYGLAGDLPLMADWSGSGLETIAVVRGSRHGVLPAGPLTWLVRQIAGGGTPDIVFEFGRHGDVPLAGDWNGDGVDTPGVYRNGTWLLRSSLTGGSVTEVEFGETGDVPVVGDWNGDGVDTPGVVRGSRWILLNTFEATGPTVEFDFGAAAAAPVVGDWDAQGRDLPGRFDNGTWDLRTSLAAGPPDISFEFGGPGDIPVVWGVEP